MLLLRSYMSARHHHRAARAVFPMPTISGGIIIIIKSTQGRVVNPLRDLVISLDLPVLQLRELINWQV
jgi:hypothetical protein